MVVQIVLKLVFMEPFDVSDEVFVNIYELICVIYNRCGVGKNHAGFEVVWNSQDFLFAGRWLEISRHLGKFRLFWLGIFEIRLFKALFWVIKIVQKFLVRVNFNFWVGICLLFYFQVWVDIIGFSLGMGLFQFENILLFYGFGLFLRNFTFILGFFMQFLGRKRKNWRIFSRWRVILATLSQVFIFEIFRRRGCW